MAKTPRCWITGSRIAAFWQTSRRFKSCWDPILHIMPPAACSTSVGRLFHCAITNPTGVFSGVALSVIPPRKKWVLWSTQLMGYQMAVMLFVGKITSNLNRINQIQFWRKMIPVPSTPNRPHDSRSPRSSDHRCTCKVARSTPAVVRALMHTTGGGALHQLELGAV